jgi:hypothetical protein
MYCLSNDEITNLSHYGGLLPGPGEVDECNQDDVTENGNVSDEDCSRLDYR